MTVKRGALGGVALALLVGLLELAAHLRQVTRPSPLTDLSAAASFVRPQLREDDLIVFAPNWVDPLGRQVFGDMLDMPRTGYADLERYARVFEVSQGGGRARALRDFATTEERSFGDVTVRVRAPSTVVPVKDDLLKHFARARETDRPDVSTLLQRGAEDNERTCPRMKTLGAGGPWDPAKPTVAASCGAAQVAPIITIDLAYQPRYCLAAVGMSSGSVLRVRFHEVRFGQRLVGHHFARVVNGAPYGIHTTHETFNAPPVKVGFYVDAESPSGVVSRRSLGEAAHQDGQSWVRFEVATPLLDGQTGDLMMDIENAQASNRTYCVELTTR
jgi:hypothetical protein